MQRLIHGLSIGMVMCATIAMPQASGGTRDKNEKTVMVGGAAMFPSKDIIDNAVNSKDHTTLVAAVKAAGLVETLQGAGPFTVFAPTNAAFVGANTVKGPALLSVSTSPAAFTAATSVV